MTKTKLNESVLKMTLNADNRARFKAAVLKDAFQKRSDQIRQNMRALEDDLVKRTWGKTPQAQAANHKAAEKLREMAQKMEVKGFKASGSAGLRGYDLVVNVGGQNFNIYFHKSHRTGPVVRFDEFLSFHGSDNTRYESMGRSRIDLTSDDPLSKRLLAIRDEANAIEEAAEELTAILDTLFGRSRTLGAAVEKWPGMAEYAPSLLSACRELTVRPEVLDKRIAALKAGTGSVRDAMSIGRND